LNKTTYNYLNMPKRKDSDFPREWEDTGAPEEEEEEEDYTIDNLGRKQWNKGKYAAQAAERGDDYVDASKSQKEVIAPEYRGYLQNRTEDLNLDASAGKRKLVTAHTIKSMQGGFWCTVCECMLKDDIAYLDHINGRKHNRLLGMNMKVERVGVDAVKDRIAKLSEKQDESEDVDVAQRLKELEEQEGDRKKRKKENKKKRKLEAEKKLEEEQAEEEAEEDEQTKMMRAMGLPVDF